MTTRTTGRDYYIGDLHIRPTDDYLTGYIPHPPYYIDQQTLDHLLSSYGTIKEASFVATLRNTRIGAYKFKLQLKADVSRPTCLRYHVKQCAFCKRFGHVISSCRKKKAAEAERLHTTTLQKEENHQVRMTNHRLLRTEMEDALILLQADYATATRNLESVFSSVCDDPCTTKASDAQLQLWGSISEAESDSIRDGFEMVVTDLQQTCVDRRTVFNDAYTAQGSKLDNLPPSIFKDTTTLLNVLPPADSLPDDPASHDALLSDVISRRCTSISVLLRTNHHPSNLSRISAIFIKLYLTLMPRGFPPNRRNVTAFLLKRNELLPTAERSSTTRNNTASRLNKFRRRKPARPPHCGNRRLNTRQLHRS